MKKLLIIALLGFATALPAQNKVYHVPVQAQNSIVRNYIPDGKWIVYYETSSSERHFALTDLNDFHDVTINTDFIVKDFEVIDDTVIFCGTTNNGNSAFVGWFHIPTFFSGSSPFKIDCNLSPTNLNSLDNIEVFRNPSSGFLHIAGYGHDNTLQVNNCHSFEAVCSAADLTILNYRTKPLNCIDSILDMTVTDNYVVLGGKSRFDYNYQNNCPEVVIFPFTKYNMLGSLTDTYYHFHTGHLTNGDEPFQRQMKVTTIIGDSIATATLKKETISGISDIYFVIRKYDVNFYSNMCTPIKVNHGNGPGMIVGFEYAKLYNTFYALNRLRYLPTRMVSFGTISRFDYTFGVPSVADNDLYQYVGQYHSICQDDGYLATGSDYRNGNLLLYRGKISFGTSCDPGLQESVQSETLTASPIETSSRSATGFNQVNWTNKPIINHLIFTVHILCE